MNRPTFAEIIAALPYLSVDERGRLRHQLIQPIPRIAEPDPPPKPPIGHGVQTMGTGKTLRIKEGSGH